MLDYLIVGAGLAGLSFAETLSQNGKSFKVISNQSQNSSLVAGGLYNPVILKRFSSVWRSKEQVAFMIPFYENLESKLGDSFFFQMPIYRKFFSIEEQNNWFVAADNEKLSDFLSTKLVTKTIPAIDSPFGFGEVRFTGYLDIAKFVKLYISYLNGLNLFLNEDFEYDRIQINNEFISYKGISAKKIVFAEGFGVLENPYFNFLPLDGTKGESFVIKAPKLQLTNVVNTSVFILPIGNDLYKVGATYNWKDKTNLPTEEGKQELVERIKEIINCDFEIVSHLAGIRPTVRDRRPMVGVHPVYENMYIFNGLGTRGVMIAPLLSKELFDFIENKKPLDKEANIQRFFKKYAYSSDL